MCYGKNGKIFTMYKLRSMYIDAESSVGAVWTQDGDPRVTRLGHVLRKCHLDELPQLYNVIRGEMDLCGPRPERPYFVDQFMHTIPKYMIKHQVRPGMSGWAQVNGWRGDTSIEERIKCDIYYIENWSLMLDVRIVLLTMFGKKVKRGAY